MVALSLPVLVLVALGALRQQEEERDPGTRFFAMPMSRGARELATTAKEHLQAERWSEGIAILQSLYEEHGAEVLPQEWRRSASEYSQFASHPGAGEWALDQLLSLPAEARELYRQRFEPQAADALSRALLAPERSVLLAVVRHWPIAPSAVRAWRALGDLELERGGTDAARMAWQRAFELANLLALPAAAGDGAREEWLVREADAAGATPPARRAPPRADAQPWTRLLDLAPFSTRGGKTYGRNALAPLLAGDHLLVSSTMRLHALDAFTGEVQWTAGPPTGWTALAPKDANDLYEGIHWDQILVAPAASNNVALAVLQTPFSETENQNWQGIHIMSAIPERRLFAYDLETGRELWNHAPPLTWDAREQRWQWDESSTPYPQRMMVAAPPTVVGSRVLVPCYRMQGRIDYHVACYELETGELLWFTPIVSGQRERNMFGRSRLEFAATPVVASDQRVIAQTELGTVAALDLFTGRILWQSLYRQTPLPKTTSYVIKPRPQTWRLSSPVVAGELVLCTPSDSDELVALRLGDGRSLWAVPELSLQRLDRSTQHLEFNLFLGAEGDTLYLGGRKLSAIQKPGGFSGSSPFKTRWVEPLPERDASEASPRPILCDESILVPSGPERAAYSRMTGERLEQWTGTWNGGESGNVWVGDDALFSVSGMGASGYFDWHALLERTRLLAETVTGSEALRSAAELFQRRGTLTLETGELSEARECFALARTFYARLREHGEPPDRWRAGVFTCLRSLAEIHALEGRSQEALELLDEARPEAPDEVALRDLLLQEERLLRGRDPARRIAVLDEIEGRTGELPLPPDVLSESLASWTGTEGLSPSPEPSDSATVAAGLWARIERAAERARLQEIGPALDDLSTALQRASALEDDVGRTVAALVRARIARLLTHPDGRAAYAPFEEQAAALLEEARASGDPAALEEVARRFPHSHAAEQALDERIEIAVHAGDARTVAALACDALQASALEPARDARLALRLAHTLGRAGNRTYELALYRELAREQPGLVSDIDEHGGKTVAELAQHALPEDAAPPGAPVTFDPTVLMTGREREGLHEYLGTIPASRPSEESVPVERQVYAGRDELVAFSSAAPGVPAWRRAWRGSGRPGSVAFAPGRMYFAEREELSCLDENGEELWRSPLDSGTPARRLAAHDGVLVVLTEAGGVRAFDAEGGIPLWQSHLGENGNWSGPLCSSGRAIFFSQLHNLTPRARVLDLLRGRGVADYSLTGLDAAVPLDETAWIAGERLIAPAFQQRPSHVSAFDVETGERAWRCEFGRDEELASILLSEGRAFAITLPSRPASEGVKGKEDNRNGALFEIDVAGGGLRGFFPFRPGERPMGIAPRTRLELAAPYVFAISEGDRSVNIRAIHLPYGNRWTWSLPVLGQELYDGIALPMPAVSSECVAIAYRTRGAGPTPMDETSIVFVDRSSGKLRDTLQLGVREPGSVREIELRGLGDALFVLARGSSPRTSRLAILEKTR